LNISELCRLFGFSKQSYYKRNVSLVSDGKELESKVLGIRHLLPRCGVRKIHYLINQDAPLDQQVGRDHLFDFMRERSLLISKRKKYHKTTNSKHWMRKYPNIIREMELTRPEQLWVADITYLEVNKGHYYLHLITDAYSKRIVGYELSNNMMATTTLAALKKAIKNRKYQEALIHHSDRGLQYSSEIYTRMLKNNGIKISMTEQSDPYENAVAERVNGILKDEFGLDNSFDSYEIFEKQVIESIALYTQVRPHLSIDYLTPNQARN
jgi:transposase InsO family protein